MGRTRWPDFGMTGKARGMCAPEFYFKTVGTGTPLFIVRVKKRLKNWVNWQFPLSRKRGEGDNFFTSSEEQLAAQESGAATIWFLFCFNVLNLVLTVTVSCVFYDVMLRLHLSHVSRLRNE